MTGLGIASCDCAIVFACGLGHIEPGPIDNTPTPDEPGHPEYHRRQRIDIAIRRWKNATPYRYQQATATHPKITAWADRCITNPRTAGILLLTGPFGTGKTHQAYGALRRIAEAGPDRFEVIALTAPDMYALLRHRGPRGLTGHQPARAHPTPHHTDKEQPMPDTTPATPAETPALSRPAIRVACPTCGAEPGALCTSHGGARVRRYDVHRARTAAHAQAVAEEATQ